MPSPQTLLPILLGGAIGAAGVIQGIHWRSSSTPTDLSELENQLRIAGEENALLIRENESLRSLAQGGGEFAVPQEMVDRAEKELGLQFKSSPVIHRIGNDELRDRVDAAIESRYGPSGMDDRQEAYQLIGWLRPGDRLLDQLTATRSVGALTWFDDTTGAGWVTARFEIKNIPDQAALLRIISRILLYQNFPTSSIYAGDDAARARDALHEGIAAGFEARFYAESALRVGFVPMKSNSEAEQLLSSFSPFLQGLVTFPLIEGKQLADSLRIQGNQKLIERCIKPPSTTRSVILPGESTAVPLALDLPAVPEEPFLTETAGSLGLRLWLEPLGDVGAAAEIASFWKNDRYVFFHDGESSSAVLWDIELETAAAANQLEAAALNLTAAMGGQETAATLGKAVVSPEKRHLLVSRRSPTRLRFLNTFDPATAAMLHDK